MTLEPAHFRGCCVPFELNRHDGAIGVRGRFRGKRQDRLRKDEAERRSERRWSPTAPGATRQRVR